jgi:hypothetical protein
MQSTRAARARPRGALGALVALALAAACSGTSATPATPDAGAGALPDGAVDLVDGAAPPTGDGGNEADAAPAVDAGRGGCGTFEGVDAGADAAAPPILHTLVPQATDPAITTTWNAPHYAYVDPHATRRCKLVLFLVGLGGKPADAQTYLAHVARRGFHVLGLTYANTISPAPTCQNDPDVDCHLKLRQEELDGTDVSPLLVVSRADSIENRVVKALAALAAAYPTEGWSAYSDSATAPRWYDILVTGHSHGSSTAGVIGKLRKVARVVMLAGPYDFRAVAPTATTGTPASWLTNPSLTDAANFYGFVHLADTQAPQDQTNWDAAGLPTVGTRVSVDGAPAPYSGSHQLTTNLAGGGHGSVLTNAAYAPVWDYLLE